MSDAILVERSTPIGVPMKFRLTNVSKLKHTISRFSVLYSTIYNGSSTDCAPTYCLTPSRECSGEIDIMPNERVHFTLTWTSPPEIHGKGIRTLTCVVIFRFSGEESPSFVKSVSIAFEYCSPSLKREYDLVKKSATYTPLQPPTRRPPKNLHRAYSQADRLTQNEIKCRLPEVTMKNLSKEQALLMFGEADMPTMDTYISRFTACVHVNEKFEREELERYALMDAPVLRVGNDGKAGWFRVRGLLEDRPSVMVGDSICLGIPASQQHRVGCVVEVHRDELCVRLHHGHVFHANTTYDLFFMAQRFSILMQHKALQALDNNPFVLSRMFPAPSTSNSVVGPVAGLPYISVPLNHAQRLAVRSILAMPPSRKEPFVLFGPPGTGKTHTFVATVMSLLESHRNSNILVVAPSNSAADHFYDKLVDMFPPETDIVMPFRLLSVGELLKRNHPYGPQTWARIDGTRCVIATCITAGKLCGHPEGLPPSFTHVFVDEAGQASEMDTLCALMLACPPTAQWILGGDHRQLGPVVKSNLAKNNAHFDRSFMERIMSLPPYTAQPDFNSHYVVQLVQNYRSHCDFIEVPSALFYMNKLIPGGTNMHTSLATWSGLPVRGVPMFVHHMTGLEDRQQSDPSWFNLSEVYQVLTYIEQLMADTTLSPRVTADQIAIISPYRGQVKKFQALLADKGWSDVTVGSVEKFQGREARVVLISSVRSNVSDAVNAVAEEDEDNPTRLHPAAHLGFLRNPKRFNTCVTRAQELMILVGNVHVLNTDTCWKTWIDNCMAKRAVKGWTASPPELPTPRVTRSVSSKLLQANEAALVPAVTVA